MNVENSALHAHKANPLTANKAVTVPYAVSMHMQLADEALDALRGQHHESWQFAGAQKVLHMQAHALGVVTRRSQ